MQCEVAPPSGEIERGRTPSLPHRDRLAAAIRASKGDLMMNESFHHPRTCLNTTDDLGAFGFELGGVSGVRLRLALGGGLILAGWEKWIMGIKKL